MAGAKLTQGKVNDFTCPADKAAVILWDTLTPGFGLKASKGGRKAYVFQGRLAGQSIRITIGSADTWPLESVTDKAGREKTRGARQEARRLQTLLDNGIDPREEKRERIATQEAKRAEARSKDVTVGEAWSAYIEARKHRWSERHLLNHERLAKKGGKPLTRGRRPDGPDTTQSGPIYPLLALRLSGLTLDVVKHWLKKEAAKRPTQTEGAFRKLRTFLAWCAEQPEYRKSTDTDIFTSKAIRELVPKLKPKNDVLQREQLAPWFAAVQKIRNPIISAYLQTLFITGARREELAMLKWADVDFQWQSLTIRDKVEGERTIPLTPYVSLLLSTLPRYKAKNGKPLPWVFASPTAADGRLQEPRIQHVKALTAAGLPHVSIHGLRRSFGTLSEWVEAPVGVVAQIMGHKPSALAEKHYRRRPLDLLRMWHTRIEAWILEQAGIEQPKEGKAGLLVVKGGKK